MAEKEHSKMVNPLPLEPLCWLTVDIPENTTRRTSLQRITTLSEKSDNNPKMLVHFENQRAFFRFLDEKMFCRLIATTECDSDLELRDTYIVQYGKEVVFCNPDGNFFQTFFPNKIGRRIEYTNLLSNERNNLENAVSICQGSEVTVNVNEKTVSVKTGENQPDFQKDLKKEKLTCQVHHMKLKQKCEASPLGSPARVQAEMLAEKSEENPDKTQDNTENNFNTSDEDRIIVPNVITNVVVNTDTDAKYEQKHVRKSTNSDIKELSNEDSITIKKLINRWNAGDEIRAPPLKSGKGVGPTGLLQKARNNDAYLNSSIHKVQRKATKHYARDNKCFFKKKTKYSQKTRKKKSNYFIKKRLCYNACEDELKHCKEELIEHKGVQMYSVSYKKQIELPEKREKKSTLKKTTKFDMSRNRSKKNTMELFGRKIEEVESIVEKKSNDEEIVKRRQKKPFRSKGWSWNTYDNFKEKYMLDEDAFTQSLFRGNSTDKYSKEIIKMLRELTDLPCHERTWKVNAYVYPSRRAKSSKSSRRRNQQGRTHSSWAAEGIPDQFQTQVSDAVTDSLNLPPAELVHTSNATARTTNLMASMNAERGLVSRIRGQLPESRFSRPQQPPRYPRYADQPSRQRSYSNWPTTNGQDSTRMAIYGFFYTGQFDLIRCFQCGIGLKDWAAQNEPIYEHIKHSPDCQFLKDLLGQELLNTNRNDQLHDNQYQFAHQSSSENRAQTVERIRNPQYSDPIARLQSYDNWPATSLQRPQNLADAGLFYTGYSDICRCFMCGGGLQRWDADDDPWIEHARWFPHCAYVRQIKGQGYINMVQGPARQTREEEEDVVVPHLSPSRRQVHPRVSQCQGRCPVRQEMAEPSFQGEEHTIPDVQLFPGQRGQDRGNRQQREPVNVEFIRMDCPICRGLFLGDYTEISLGEEHTIPDVQLFPGQRGQDRGNRQQREPVNVEFIRMDCPICRGLFLGDYTEISLEEQNRQLRASLICNVCEENNCNILFIPCGHHRVCEHCAHNITTVCPYCGSRIDEKIKTFMN